MRSSSSLTEDSLVGRRIGGGHNLHIRYANIAGRVHSLSEMLSYYGVIVKRLGRLGDVVMVEPIVRYLRKLTRVGFETSSEYRGLVCDPLEWHYNHQCYMLDLEMYAEQHPLAGQLHRTDIFASSIGVKLSYAESVPSIEVSEESEIWVGGLLGNSLEDGNYIVYAPSSLSPSRTWEDGDKLIPLLESEYPTVVVSVDGWRVNGVPISPRCINDLYSIIRHSKLVVSPDSGAMHLAGAAKISFVALYTQKEEVSSNPQLRCRYYGDYTVVESDNLNLDYVFDVVSRAFQGETLGRFIEWKKED